MAALRARMLAALPEALARVDWPREKLAAYRDEALKRHVAHARIHSPWHAARLAGVDPDSFAERNLARLPTMTKADLMANFDAIVTDPRAKLAGCEAHVKKGELLLDDELVVNVSGGTSGVRALAVHRADNVDNTTSLVRMIQRWGARTGAFAGIPRVASVTAPEGPNGSSTVLRGVGGGAILAVTDPIEAIVRTLNGADPELLVVYPSFLPRLRDAADAGGLRIRPKLVAVVAEPCLPEHHAAVEAAWGSTVIAGYGCTEVGMLGVGSGFDDGLLLNDDFAVIEPADRHGAPAGPGQRAAKLLVTPLFRRTLPLIRYEVTDQLTLSEHAPSCGSGLRLASAVDGRLDDVFTYDGGIVVHPGVFRAVLGASAAILEYQVRQTPKGAVIRVVCKDPLDHHALSDALARSLTRVGLSAPAIDVTEVAAIGRTAGSAKLKRFVPLARD